MLIRSVNKEEFVSLELNNITVVGCEVRSYSPAYPDDCVVLGKYESKVRAIEVLDNIEYLYGSQTVYRMPEK